MNFRPVLFVIGILLSIMALSLTFPMLIDLYRGNADWRIFFICAVITAFFGGSLVLSNMGQIFSMNVRQAFFLVFLSWSSISLFGAFPFYFSEMQLSFTDSFFESISGVTTTGATIITGLEQAPPGILLWRAILQWLGGIGIILMAMSVLPFLKIGGMQIFQTELSESEKILPRATKLASSIGLIYVGLTALCAICYMLVGMGTFDAIAHAMTTVATGGYSTFDTSFAHYHHASTELVAITFMILGALPFILYLRLLKGDGTALIKDSQVIWFLSIVFFVISILVLYLTFQNHMPFFESLRRVSFSVVSVITGTGYSNGDYDTWGGFSVCIFLFLTTIGGCAGSTSCGIKIFRFQILYAIVLTQIKKLLQPHGVFIPHYNGKPIPQDVPVSVVSFFFLYTVSFAVLAVALSFTGLDFLTALSGAATSISNVGPGLGPTIGPSGTFQPLPDSAKWILSAGMLLGRLELFTVMVMLFPQFWRH